MSSFVSCRGDCIESYLVVLLFIFISSACLLLIRSMLLFDHIRKKKHRQHIPKGKITYSDLNIPAKPLFSARYLLAGKPDYIVSQKNTYIPVERKSGSAPAPQHSHLLQVAAYCQILEDVYEVFVPYGILVYNNAQHTINFDPRLRFELQSVITSMRHALLQKTVTRNHHDLRRCRACSLKKYCTERLV